MTSLNPGYCGIDDTFIGGKNNPDYAEFSMVLSNETLARQSVCSTCIVKLTDGKVDKLFERVKSSWKDQMVGWATDKQFDRIDVLTVKAWDIEEAEAINKYKIVKEKDKKARLLKAKKEQNAE